MTATLSEPDVTDTEKARPCEALSIDRKPCRRLASFSAILRCDGCAADVPLDICGFHLRVVERDMSTCGNNIDHTLRVVAVVPLGGGS